MVPRDHLHIIHIYYQLKIHMTQLKKQSRLHRKIKYPYYIFTPNYRESSSGIQALHYLCHALNLEGAKAYIAGAKITNPDLHTPLLEHNLILQHKKAGTPFIAVYSDIISDNPLNAPVVVRYMLNKEGVINGNRIYPTPGELRFYFREEFYDPQIPGDIIFTPMIDLEEFKPDPLIKRDLNLLYLNRVPRSAVDFSKLPSDITVLSMEDPLTLKELAAVLKRGKVLYSFEMSSTCSLAACAGCPVVSLFAPNFEKYSISTNDIKNSHGAFLTSDEKNQIQKAQEKTTVFRDFYTKIEDQFWNQLQNFIEKTQNKALEIQESYQSTRVLFSHPKKFTAREKEDIQKHLVSTPYPSIDIVIQNPTEDEETLHSFIQHLTDDTALQQKIHLHILSPKKIAVTSAIPATFIESPENGFIAAINSVGQQSSADWLLVCHADDTPIAYGLESAALALRSAQGLSAAYTDSVLVSGMVHEPVCAPDFNLDMLLSCPAGMNHPCFFNRAVFAELGGFSESLENSHALDLLLRIVEEKGLASIAHISEALLTKKPPILQKNATETAVIQQHLQRRGYDAAQLHEYAPGRYHVHYKHPTSPLVSIVISTHHHLALAQRCLTSILEKTAYENYEIIFTDHGSTEAAWCTWLDGLDALQDPRIHTLRCPSGMNASAIQNASLSKARGDYLLFLSGDSAIVDSHWLNHLLNHAQRPEVGVVGPKIINADGNIQSAGLVLGLNGPANSAFLGQDAYAPGYMHRLEIDQNYSAVSGTCLMVRREIFEHVGGFAEEGPLSHYSDVDVCLKIRQAGFLVVWTPHTVVLQSEKSVRTQSTDPQLSSKEALQLRDSEHALYEKWLPAIAHDGAYNENLSLAGQGFEIETNIDLVTQPLPWRPVPVALAIAADPYGCGHYRIIHPGHCMTMAGVADVRVSNRHYTPVEMERLQPDTWVLQRQTTDAQYEFIQRSSKLTRAFKVGELDDYLPNLPMKSVHRAHMPKDILRAMRRWLGEMDRFVVSTEPLAEALGGLHRDIRVVHNRLPPERWRGLKSLRQQGRRPRVGWAGGVGHQGDLEMIADVVKALAGEVDWVFFGMCPEPMRKYVHEFHGPASFEKYPKRLANLDLDLAVAPLESNLFNDCKSNLRLLEYGACGFPVVCTDALPYRCDLPVTRVKNRHKDWVEAIRMHINDLDATAAAGDALRAAVLKDWMLEGEHLEHWLKAWLPD